MSVVIGLDLATATVRGTAVQAAGGAVLATAQRPMPAPVRPGDGSSRQQPRYAELARQVLAELADRLAEGGRGPVVAISVTGTSGKVVPCDLRGRPVGAAVLYDDRSAGGEPFPRGSVPARMALLARDPALPPGPGRLQFTPDVVLADLAGEPLPTDTSHALKAGIDPAGRSWEAATRAAAGRMLLPELAHPGTPVGHLSPAAAADLGLPGPVVLISGMTDGCTAQIACGAVEPGDTVGVLGTTLVLKAVAAERIESDGVYSHLAPGGWWWAGAAANLGAGALRGFTDLPAMDLAAQAHGPASVRCYPLTGVGERFPIADPHYRAWWSGEPRSEIDRYRAVLEAVAFTERLGLERLSGLGAPSRRHHAAGGGSRSAVWNQLRADVLGMPVHHTAEAGSGYGAAALAAAGSGGGTLAGILADWIGRTEVVEPDPEPAERLSPAYLRWREELPPPGRPRRPETFECGTATSRRSVDGWEV